MALSFPNRRPRSKNHGLSRSPEHNSWQAMLNRCTNQTYEHYYLYGGRGIRVCKAWQECFMIFLKDLGPKPSPQHTIDRKDNEGHYSCGKCSECIENGWLANCYWVTKKEQGRNRRTNHLVEHSGKTLCIKEWSEITGLPKGVIRQRLEAGWSPEKALTTPPLCRIDLETAREIRTLLEQGIPESQVALRFSLTEHHVHRLYLRSKLLR